MDLVDLLVNIAGFAIIILATYMIVRNVIQPRFFFPWLRKRKRDELIERGSWLIDNADLTEDEHERVQSALATLRMGRASGESWTREDPFNAARTDIEAIWLTHGHDGHQDSLPKTGEG